MAKAFYKKAIKQREALLFRMNSTFEKCHLLIQFLIKFFIADMEWNNNWCGTFVQYLSFLQYAQMKRDGNVFHNHFTDHHFWLWG